VQWALRISYYGALQTLSMPESGLNRLPAPLPYQINWKYLLLCLLHWSYPPLSLRIYIYPSIGSPWNPCRSTSGSQRRASWTRWAAIPRVVHGRTFPGESPYGSWILNRLVFKKAAHYVYAVCALMMNFTGTQHDDWLSNTHCCQLNINII